MNGNQLKAYRLGMGMKPPPHNMFSNHDMDNREPMAQVKDSVFYPLLRQGTYFYHTL